MSTENTNQKKDPAPQKEGFFTRIFTKIDNSMKVKADEAAKNQCCGEDNDGRRKVLLRQDPILWL